jgi:phenylpropionate dioxygenase-like ring-hydroxylating dioxygenase large terminal subunit
MYSNDFPAGWYAIVASDEIKLINHPYTFPRFGINLVIWRNEQGLIRVMVDKCPHRSARISIGKVINDEIICPFHGFRFGGDGKCNYAPEFGKAIPGLNTMTFKVAEKFSMIWVCFGNETSDLNLAQLTDLTNLLGNDFSEIQKTWQANITRCIENQLDYTHLPMVHKSTIGRNFEMPVNPRFIVENNCILSFHRDNNQNPSSEYIFPNSWILHISAKMKLVVFFVPISSSQTKFYLRTYNSLVKNKLLRFFFNRIINLSNRIILAQDRKVVESQGAESSHLMQNELLMRHDGAIKLFRNLWRDNFKCEFGIRK